MALPGTQPAPRSGNLRLRVRAEQHVKAHSVHAHLAPAVANDIARKVIHASGMKASHAPSCTHLDGNGRATLTPKTSNNAPRKCAMNACPSRASAPSTSPKPCLRSPAQPDRWRNHQAVPINAALSTNKVVAKVVCERVMFLCALTCYPGQSHFVSRTNLGFGQMMILHVLDLYHVFKGCFYMRFPSTLIRCKTDLFAGSLLCIGVQEHFESY